MGTGMVRYAAWACWWCKPAPARRDRTAAVLVPIDVLTLGPPTLLNRVIPGAAKERARRQRRFAVSHDRNGKVPGVVVDVGDFSVLPADGKASPRP